MEVQGSKISDTKCNFMALKFRILYAILWLRNFGHIMQFYGSKFYNKHAERLVIANGFQSKTFFKKD
jgi:hypothetical protein